MVNKFRDVVKHPGVKEYSSKRGKIGILAVHGGRLDHGTEQVANYVHAKTPASLYVMSSRGGDIGKHRVASTQIAHTHSKHLNDIISHVNYNISIHGHNKPGHEKTIYVGGENAYLRQKVAAKLKQYLPSEYTVEHDVNKMPRNVRGTGRNVTNRSKEGGVKVELPTGLRQGVGKKYDSPRLTGITQKVGQAISEVVNGEFKAKPDLHYKGKEYKGEYQRAA